MVRGNLEFAGASWHTAEPAALPPNRLGGRSRAPPLGAVEQAYVRRVLEHTGGRRMAAAQLLGISYPTFLKRLRELELDKPKSDVHAATGRLRQAH